MTLDHVNLGFYDDCDCVVFTYATSSEKEPKAGNCIYLMLGVHGDTDIEIRNGIIGKTTHENELKAVCLALSKVPKGASVKFIVKHHNTKLFLKKLLTRPPKGKVQNKIFYKLGKLKKLDVVYAESEAEINIMKSLSSILAAAKYVFVNSDTCPF